MLCRGGARPPPRPYKEDFVEIQFTPYQAEVLTPNFHIAGELHPRGNPTIYINDSQYPTFTLYSATLSPAAAGASLPAMSMSELYVVKDEVHVLALHGFERTSAQLLPATHRLICFTDTYVIRGNFHTGPETRAADVFYMGAGPFYGASDVEVFPVRPLAIEVSLSVPLAFVHRGAVRAFYLHEG